MKQLITILYVSLFLLLNLCSPEQEDENAEVIGQETEDLVTQPELLFPENNSVQISIKEKLRWNLSEWVGEDKGYIIHELRFGASNPPEQFVTISDWMDGLLIPEREFNTTYYWQIVALNYSGEELASSSIYSFTTENCPDSSCGCGSRESFTDPRDGEVYNIVTIGTDCWFAENLHYDTENSLWFRNGRPEFKIFGKYYTWYEAKSACPDGWHLSTSLDWDLMIAELGGLDVAGGKLKHKEYWESPNTGATNSSGMSMLGGGFITADKTTVTPHVMGNYWVDGIPSPNYIGTAPYYRMMADSEELELNILNRNNYLNCRCVEDEDN
ncbi:MAG: FISUMP domain-containing protein [Leeuwenhoekiella sp.]